LIWIVIIGLIVILPFLLVIFSGAPYVPTFTRDLEDIFKEVKLPQKAIVVDLGSGDGRLLLIAAQRGYTAIGYEINPILWLISVWRLRKYPNAHTYLRSLWKADVREADLVFTFLNKIYAGRLEKKLLAEMKPGSYFSSFGFAYGNLELIKKHRANHIYKL